MTVAGIFRRKQSPVVLAAMREGCDGMTGRAIAETLGLSEDTVQRALADLRMMGLVHPAKTLIPYDKPWPAIKEEHTALVLREIRREPRPEDEIAADIGQLEDDKENIIIVRHRARKLRRLGHIAPPGAWLIDTTKATKEGRHGSEN